MKFFKSFSLIVILAFAVAAVCGMVKGLSALCVFLGIGKLVEGKEYYDDGKQRTAFLYWGIGIAVCICGVLSFTNWV